MTTGIVSAEELSRRVDAFALRQASSLCERIVPVVMDVAWLLRDHPEGAATLLNRLDEREMRAFAVVAAAAIDVDATPERLLGWTRELADKPLMPCGTHAAFNRHKNAGEPPCEACCDAERAYQRGRTRQPRSKIVKPRETVGPPRSLAS